jgi:hypothetical protein
MSHQRSVWKFSDISGRLCEELWQCVNLSDISDKFIPKQHFQGYAGRQKG